MRINAITLLRGSDLLANRVSRSLPEGVERHLFVAPEGFQWAGATHRPAFRTAHQPLTLEHSQAKCDYIVDLYNEFLPELCADSDAVLLFEDDIQPPTDGLAVLADALERSTEDVAAVVSIYPQQSDPSLSMVWGKPYEEALSIADIPRFPIPIYRGGTGFALFRSSALLKALPLKRDPEGVDWCEPLGRRLGNLQFRTFAHGGVRCGHSTE